MLRIGKAGEPLASEILDREQGANLPACRIGDDEAVRLRQRLKPGGKVGRLADDPALLRRTLTDQLADHNQTRGNTDTDGQAFRQLEPCNPARTARSASSSCACG